MTLNPKLKAFLGKVEYDPEYNRLTCNGGSTLVRIDTACYAEIRRLMYKLEVKDVNAESLKMNGDLLVFIAQAINEKVERDSTDPIKFGIGSKSNIKPPSDKKPVGGIPPKPGN